MTRAVSMSLTAGCLVLSLAACDEGLIAPTVGATELVTSSPWKLQSIDRPGVGVVRATDPDRFTLLFSEQGGVAVVADCNRCSGSYTIGIATVSIPLLACTRAFCMTAPFDTDYVSVLNGDNAAAVHGATLQLSSARGTLRFAR